MSKITEQLDLNQEYNDYAGSSSGESPEVETGEVESVDGEGMNFDEFKLFLEENGLETSPGTAQEIFSRADSNRPPGEGHSLGHVRGDGLLSREEFGKAVDLIKSEAEFGDTPDAAPAPERKDGTLFQNGTRLADPTSGGELGETVYGSDGQAYTRLGDRTFAVGDVDVDALEESEEIAFFGDDGDLLIHPYTYEGGFSGYNHFEDREDREDRRKNNNPYGRSSTEQLRFESDGFVAFH